MPKLTKKTAIIIAAAVLTVVAALLGLDPETLDAVTDGVTSLIEAMWPEEAIDASNP